MVTVQFGATSEASNWEVLNFSSRNRGVHHNSNSVTLSSEEGQTYIPTSGTFMIVRPTVTVQFSAKIYCYQKSWLYLVDADNGTSRTTITDGRTNNTQKTGTATLTAGKTYYIYGDNNASNWTFVSFTAKTPELVRLETEITSAQALYDNDAYTEGKATLNTAIETATALSTNNAATTENIVAGIKALLEAEGVFLAANGNQNYIVASNEYVYCGRPVKNVKSIVMTYGGKEGTNTWGVGTSSLTGSYTGNSYTNTTDCGAYGSNNGARCNGTTTVSNLPNQGTYFTFAPTESGVLTVCMLYCSSRNMFLADGDKNTIDYYNPGSSNYYGERAYKLEAGKTYYLWQDNNNYAKLYGFRFVPTDVTKIVGDVNYTSAYNTVFGDDITLTAGTKCHVNFQNHGVGGANNNENFHVYIKNGGANKAIMRADWWDDVANANTGFTDAYKYSSDGGSTTTAIDWATFRSDMKDANVDLTITYAGGTVTVEGTATKGDHIYYYNFSNGAGALTGDVTVNLSVNKAWLEVISTEKFVAATVGANGYTTFASTYPLDLTDANRPAGLKAYKATLTGSTLSFTKLNQTVPAGTGLLLLGETKGGSYDIPVASSVDDITTAFTGVTTATAKHSVADDTYYFVMKKAASAESPLEFAPLSTSDVTIPAGKAYITVPNSAFTGGGARALDISFDDEETTGINAVNGEGLTVNGSFFDLQGRRVAQPTKGLYIVNGKKVVIK